MGQSWIEPTGHKLDTPKLSLENNSKICDCSDQEGSQHSLPFSSPRPSCCPGGLTPANPRSAPQDTSPTTTSPTS